MALARWQATITDESGNVVPEAEITVRREVAGLPLAVLYSDRDGATPLGNPFDAEADGFAAFYVDGGMYQIVASLGGFTRTWNDVGIGTASGADADDFASAGQGALAATAVQPAAIASMLEASDIGVSVQAFDADTLKADVSDNLEKGFTATSVSAGTKSSGTFTPDPTLGNFQHATNGGAHTLAPPSSVCSILLEYVNNGSAGAITTSGFTKVTGTFTTTNGHKFHCSIVKSQNYSSLTVVALQ